MRSSSRRIKQIDRRCLALLALILTPSALHAQRQPLSLSRTPGRYTPLDQQAVPGKVGHWNLLAKPSLTGYYQPVQVHLPTSGSVSFFTPHAPGAVTLPAPAQAGMLIGAVYRIRIADLPEYPGLELFPTIEVTDRLHPPTGREAEFPIPVEITTEEIEAVRADRMVTKVVYLERPQNASTLVSDRPGLLTFDVPPRDNLLDTADQLGRPVAILRLGGRVPDPRNPADDLIGPAPPIWILAPPGATAPQ